jgi:hypothetical protein
MVRLFIRLTKCSAEGEHKTGDAQLVVWTFSEPLSHFGAAWARRSISPHGALLARNQLAESLL